MQEVIAQAAAQQQGQANSAAIVRVGAFAKSLRCSAPFASRSPDTPVNTHVEIAFY